MAAGDIFRLTLVGAAAGQEILVTNDFRQVVSPSTPTGEPERDLVDAWQAICQTLWLATQPSSYSLGSLTCQQVCGATKPYRGKYEETVGATGTNSSLSGSTPWLAALVRESTAFAGRSYAGRFFMPCLDEQYYNGTSLTSTFTTPANAYVTALSNAFRQGGTDNIWDLVVFSRKLNGGNAGNCSTSAAGVIGLSLGAYLTTNRSRRSRSGA